MAKIYLSSEDKTNENADLRDLFHTNWQLSHEDAKVWSARDETWEWNESLWRKHLESRRQNVMKEKQKVLVSAAARWLLLRFIRSNTFPGNNIGGWAGLLKSCLSIIFWHGFSPLLFCVLLSVLNRWCLNIRCVSTLWLHYQIICNEFIQIPLKWQKINK